MHGRDKPSSLDGQSYRRQTLRPLNNLVFVLPLLAFFELGQRLAPSSLLTPRVIMSILDYFGAHGTLLPAGLIVAVLLGQHLVYRDRFRLDGQAIAGMVGESILWTVPLVAVSYLTGKLAATVTLSAAGQETLRLALLAVGAGIYEEFFFRLVLISLLMLLFIDVAGLRREIVTALCVIVAGAVFSLCHFDIGPIHGRNPFRWGHFIFLMLAGMAWGSLFLFRGFGVAVGSHITWDIYVMCLGADAV